MRRLHLFEFEDLAWLPRPIRDGGTDYLRFVTEVGGVYDPIVPKLTDALRKTGSREVLDLCSGGGGPWISLCRKLAGAGLAVRVALSDRYPNIAAFRYARERSDSQVGFLERPVDATAVPGDLPGFRTLFASLHHFRPEEARSILQDAVAQRRPIAVFDFSARRPPPLPFAALGNPLAMLMLTPFVGPFRWSRLLWTYILPLAPLYFAWDGFVSGLRLYSTRALQELVDGLSPSDYVWDIGRVGPLDSITYLIGYPGGRGDY